MSNAHTNPPSFATQLALGLGIFAAVLAVSIPLAFVAAPAGLAAAVTLGSLFLALQMRRLRFSLVTATLLAVLAAFGSAQTAQTERLHRADVQAAARQFADLAPASGHAIPVAAPREVIAAVVMLPRAELMGADGRLLQVTAIAGWAFPPALVLLWIVGLAAFTGNRALLRHLRQRLTPVA